MATCSARRLQNAISAALPPEFPNSLKRAPDSIPTIWGGLGNYGSNNNYWTIAPWNNTLDLYVAKDDASKIIGKHTLKFGALMSWNGKNEDVSTSASERPTFNTGGGNLTLPGDPGFTGTGNNLANVLLPGASWNLTETSTNIRAQLRWHDYEFYVADNWKVTPRLTLISDCAGPSSMLRINRTIRSRTSSLIFTIRRYRRRMPAMACGLWREPILAARQTRNSELTSVPDRPARAARWSTTTTT